MHADYADITSRIAEPPTWWDAHGVPRYGEPTPEACPNIYAREVAIVEIACQSCGRRFRVMEHHGTMDSVRGIPTLRAQVESGSIYYGDPPRHSWDDCYGGDTMTSNPIRVLAFWKHGDFHIGEPDWVAVPELVRDLPGATEGK